MKQLFCVIVLMACFAITAATPINAAGDKFTIRIKSEIESLSGIYLSGKNAAFLTQKIIEVWNFSEKKKIAALKFEDFSDKIPEIDIANMVPEGMKITEKEKKEIKKMMDMKKQFRISHISLSENGSKVAITQKDGSVILWDTTSNKLTPLIPSNVNRTKISPTGRFIAIIYMLGKEKSFSIIDVQKNKELLSMPSSAGVTGIINFSRNENNVWLGISEFVIGYELKTFSKIFQRKLPINFFRDQPESTGQSDLSIDEKYFVCTDYNQGLLVELTGKGRTKKLASQKHFFGNKDLITGSDPFKKIELSKLDALMDSTNSDEKDSLFSDINIPHENGIGRETFIDDSYYSFRMENELGETVVNITKINYNQSNNAAKDKAQTNDLKNKPDQNKGIPDESKILGTYSYTDEMGSSYSITLDKGGVGTEISYRAEWKIKWILNGNILTVIGSGTTTIYTVKDNQLISEDGTVYK